MKIDWNKKYTTIAVYVCLVIAFGAVCAFCAFNLGKIWHAVESVLAIFNPVIYGFAIAFLINPLFRFFENRAFKFISRKKPHVKLRRVVALVAAYLVVAILISVFALIVVPQISDSFTELQSKMSGYIQATQKWVEEKLEESRTKHSDNFLFKLINFDDLIAKIKAWISDSAAFFGGAVPVIKDFLSGFISVVKNLVMGVIISIYFLYSRDKLCAQVKKTFYAIFNKERMDRILRATRFTSYKFENFITGKLIDSLIIGILTAIVLAITKMPYPALIATIIGVTNLIPFFGPIIGAIPSAFIVFVADPGKTIWFLLIVLIIQQLDGNVIGPIILGERIGLSAMWIVISLVLMGGILGVTGLFIGVPLFSVLYAFFVDFIDKRLEKKGLPSLTEEYYRKPEEAYHRGKYEPKSFARIKNLAAKIRKKRKEKKNKKQ
ncbi:MAG: AI-2E family transporter [Clostridia bacterium]|nr:AI-2E family transporter [Clostridia bacterium]